VFLLLLNAIFLFTKTNISTTQHCHALAWRNVPCMIFQKGHKFYSQGWKSLWFNGCFLHPYMGVILSTWYTEHVTQYAILRRFRSQSLWCTSSLVEWRFSRSKLRCGFVKLSVNIHNYSTSLPFEMKANFKRAIDTIFDVSRYRGTEINTRLQLCTYYVIFSLCQCCVYICQCLILRMSVVSLHTMFFNA
jgi:hypothetical protein